MSSGTLAPIALFAFNRPDHLNKTLNALRNNNLASESELFVFCDGSRGEGDQEKVNSVRTIAKSINGFGKVTVFESHKNKGLALSVIEGVELLCRKFGKVIVVEDDLITSKYFLEFMNEGLQKYENEDRVISIHGWIYNLMNPPAKPFFIKGADCWGWATWQRGWKHFNPDGKILLAEIKRRKLESRFDFENNFPYTKMLEDNIAGKNNSWAIRWYASALLADKLTLYPNVSLVKNIGLDNSGTHCSDDLSYDSSISLHKVSIPNIKIEENITVLNEFIRFLRRKRRRSIFLRLQSLVKRFLF